MSLSSFSLRSGVLSLLFLALAASNAALSGCSSHWKESYEPVANGKAYAKSEPSEVTVREASWSRLDETLHQLEAEIAESDTRPEDWTAERRRDLKARLLSALQFPGSPDDITVLGRSVFSTTDEVRPNDGSLAKFAASIGADYAVWSSAYRGKSERVVTEPVTTYDSYSVTRDRRGRYRYDNVSGWSTTYLPIVVVADEWAYMVYYLRAKD